MADTHEGFSLGVHVDNSQLKETNKLEGVIYQMLGKIDRRSQDMKVGKDVPEQLNKISSAASATTRHLQEQNNAFKSDENSAKSFGNAAEGACKQASNSAKNAKEEVKGAGKQMEDSFNKKLKTTVDVDNAAANRKLKETKHDADDIPKQKTTTINTRDHASSILGRIKDNFKKTDQAAQQTGHTIRNFAIGGAIANGLSNIASSAYSGMKNVVKEGIQLNATAGAINASFHNMGLNRRQISGLNDQIGYLKRNVGLTGAQTATMQRQMMNWSKIGVSGAKNMTTAIAAIGASTRMPTDQIARMGGQLMRVGATGKVTVSSLNRITRNAPGFYAVLAKGAGMTQNQLKATLATGKVTQQQFQTWMANSSKYASGVFKDYSQTVGGAQARIRAGWQTLEAQMTRPLMNVRKSGMQELADLLNSKPVQQGAEMLGTAMRNVAIWATKGLGFIAKHRKDVVGIGTAFVQIAGTLAKDVWKDFTGIVFDMAKAFGLVNKNAKPGSGLHEFKTAMDGLASNQRAISLIAHSLVIIAGLKGLAAVAKPIKEIGGAFIPSPAQLVAKGAKGAAGAAGSAGASAAAGAASKAGFGATVKGLFAGGLHSTAAGIGVGVGAAALSGYDLLKAIKARNKPAKFKNYGRSLGTALGAGIGGAIGGAPGAAVGATLGHVAGGWVGKMAYQFSRSKFGKAVSHQMAQSIWDIRQSMRPLGRETRSTTGSVKAQFRGMTRDISKDWHDLNRNRDFVAFKNFIKSGIVASLRFTIKTAGNIIKTGIGVAIGLLHSIDSVIRGVAKITRGSVAVISDVFHGRWRRAFRDAGGVVRSFGGMVKGVFDGLEKVVDSLFGGLLRQVKNVWDFVSGHDWQVAAHHSSPSVSHANRTVSNFSSGAARHTRATRSSGYSIAATNRAAHLRAHAAGGSVSTTANALVGEQGPELAYKQGQARLLGVNGPQVTRVHAGEHILNARDTAKVMTGGLGAGIKLRGFAGGTDQVKKTGTSVKASYQKMTKDTKSELSKITSNNKKSWKAVNSDATKQVKSLGTKNNSQWRSIASQTKRQTTTTRKDAVSQYTKMKSGVVKQMNSLHDQTISLAKMTAKGFGKNLDRMKNYSKDAMQDTIDQVNRGIRGIDKVLGQFGGNTSVIKPVHFASGTGALPHNTLAMVNDAKTGPWQEAIYKNNGDLIIPSHKNRVLPLEKGDAVLNGYQTQTLAHKMGMEHFAKGSGASHSELRKIAERGGNNPAKSFAEMYSRNLKQQPPDIEKGTTGLAQHSSTTEGVPWMQAMWAVINQAIGEGTGKGGTREAFLHYAEKTFSGVKYVMGAASHAASDCSGMVMQALRHFGLDIGRTTVAMQHSAGVQYLGKDISKTIPGDLVIYGHGTGAAGHVGIIKNPRTHSMFNETPPYARVTSVDGPKSMGYGFYRVRGLHNAHQKKQAENKPLMALAKRELGSAAIKWIKKNLGDTLGSLGAFSMSGDIGSRARALAGGLRQLDPRATKNGIAAILGNWEFESTLNPGAVNPGGGASGLGQWLGGRLSNLKAYARRHGMSWKNPGAQLSFAVKGEGSDSAIFRRVLEGHGSVSSLANAFSSEWERGGYNAQHVAGARMIRKALGYARGGDPQPGSIVKVGEHGPELAQFKQPVHVYDHEQSKKMMSFDNLLGKPHRAAPAKSKAPTINININGPISSIHEAQTVANEVKRQVAQIIEQYFGDEAGTDPSFY